MAKLLQSMAASDAHEALRDDLVAALRKHAGGMTQIEQVALVSVLLGQMIAYQDQTKYTAQQVMECVWANLEAGNQTAIKAALSNTGGTA